MRGGVDNEQAKANSLCLLVTFRRDNKNSTGRIEARSYWLVHEAGPLSPFVVWRLVRSIA